MSQAPEPPLVQQPAAAPAPSPAPSPAPGAVRVRGADAERFLQGQLSADLRRAAPLAVNYSGLHNQHGRVLARLALARLADDDWIAFLPAPLAATVADTLRRYVLRARVTLAALPAGVLALPGMPVPGAARELHFPDGRRALCQPEATAGDAGPEHAAAWQAWEAAEVALGLAEVYPETSGSFVAQMLNLDCIGAVAFDKGCYTGQEVIARAHYRGRVKRRLQRFAVPARLGVPPGSALRLADGRGAQLVREAQRADGSCEFLAVCALPAAADPGPAAEAGSGEEAPVAEAPGAPARLAVDSRPLPLPYPLPG